MNPKRASDKDEQPTTTLGDLLYADRSKSAISEEDWASLVAAIAAGDQQALRKLYERTNRVVFTLAVRICARRELAEEITLDVFHDLWRRAAQYDPKNGSVIGWIMNQARSRAIDRLRFEQRKKRVDPGGVDDHVDPPDPSDAVDARQRRAQLQDALTTLSPEERDAIEIAFFAGLTYAETAARLDEPLGTVKTRVRSALAKLRKALAQQGGDS